MHPGLEQGLRAQPCVATSEDTEEEVQQKQKGSIGEDAGVMRTQNRGKQRTNKGRGMSSRATCDALSQILSVIFAIRWNSPNLSVCLLFTIFVCTIEPFGKYLLGGPVCWVCSDGEGML